MTPAVNDRNAISYNEERCLLAGTSPTPPWIRLVKILEDLDGLPERQSRCRRTLNLRASLVRQDGAMATATSPEVRFRDVDGVRCAPLSRAPDEYAAAILDSIDGNWP
jgi:hypothetical protein